MHIRQGMAESGWFGAPHPLQVCSLPSTSTCLPIWKDLSTHRLEIFMKVSLCEHDCLNLGNWWLTQSPAVIPSLEVGRWVWEVPKLLIKVLSFLWSLPFWNYLGAPQPRIILSTYQVHSYHIYEIPRFKEFYDKNLEQSPNIYIFYFLFYHSGTDPSYMAKSL